MGRAYFQVGGLSQLACRLGLRQFLGPVRYILCVIALYWGRSGDVSLDALGLPIPGIVFCQLLLRVFFVWVLHVYLVFLVLSLVSFLVLFWYFFWPVAALW